MTITLHPGRFISLTLIVLVLGAVAWKSSLSTADATIAADASRDFVCMECDDEWRWSDLEIAERAAEGFAAPLRDGSGWMGFHCERCDAYAGVRADSPHTTPLRESRR
ncbi:MAG: hypothetical protein ACF8PN_03090 [Phycisphaerales bacterium]